MVVLVRGLLLFSIVTSIGATSVAMSTPGFVSECEPHGALATVLLAAAVFAAVVPVCIFGWLNRSWYWSDAMPSVSLADKLLNAGALIALVAPAGILALVLLEPQSCGD